MKSIDHKKHICNYFNRAAPLYDDFATAQQQIGEHLIQQLNPYQKVFDNVIDLGCGSGLVTQKLARTLSYQLFYALDFAENLLAKANNCLQAFNIQLLQMDFDHIQSLDLDFNLIFSNMALHWSMDLAKTFSMLKNKLMRNGLLAFSIPLTDTFYELDRHRNSFFSFDKVKQMLDKESFNMLHQEEMRIKKEYPSPIQALKAIKASGTHYLYNQPKQHFIANIRTKTPFVLTYHVGSFIARNKI